MKQQVARRRNGMPIGRLNLTEGMQFCWPRRSEELIPSVRSKREDTRKARFNVAESDCTQQCRQVSAE
jgi:hypothetical protein